MSIRSYQERWVPLLYGVAFLFTTILDMLPPLYASNESHPCLYRSDIASFVVRAAAYRSAGYVNKAREEYLHALTLDSLCPDLWILLAQAYLERGDIDSSIAAAERALSIDSSLAEGYGVLADAYAVRQPQRAAWYALRAMERHSTLSDRLRAAYFVRSLDTARAIELLRQIVQEVPIEEVARDLIELCLQYRDTLQALRLMRDLLFEYPDRVELALDLSSLYLQRQRWDSAWLYVRYAMYHMTTADVGTTISQWLEFVDEHTPTTVLIETARFLLGRQDLSCAHTILLAHHFVLRHRFDYAHQLIAHAFSQPQLRRNHALAGLSLMCQWGDVPLAFGLLDTRERRFDDLWVALARYVLGRYYGGMAPSVLDSLLTVAFERDSTDPTILFYVAYRADSLGQRARAIDLYQRLVFADPNNVAAANNLAYILAQQGTQLFYALELAERALRADSSNASYLDTYGWVLHRMGRYQEALEYLQRAVESAQEPSATLFEHLGDNYNSLGRVEDARKCWMKAYELDHQRIYLLKRLER
ncbi:MAG: tetratricopeptide repeat protein [Chlorobi bacterium]|nr:tetratricopeptide repeat protein [Chlorobiota bacterium]